MHYEFTQPQEKAVAIEDKSRRSEEEKYSHPGISDVREETGKRLVSRPFRQAHDDRRSYHERHEQGKACAAQGAHGKGCLCLQEGIKVKCPVESEEDEEKDSHRIPIMNAGPARQGVQEAGLRSLE